MNRRLLRAIAHPGLARDLSLTDWDRLVPLARRARLLPRLATHLPGGPGAAPEPVRPHLEAALAVSGVHERMIRWEVDRIRRALDGTGITIVLLKGAAYVMGELPCARGRMVADVDVMVSKSDLATVEGRLQASGWAGVKLDDYDQQYYRRWMHELPPLRHRLRGTFVDVHHTILPETSRLRPDPLHLLAAARPVDGEGVRILAPADMVLHSAAHAFHDGDLANGLRDLVDLHDLVCHFDHCEADFWPALVERARLLGLQRPLYYGLRYTTRFLGTPVPVRVLEVVGRAGPPAPVPAIMDALVDAALPGGPGAGAALASGMLYLRSHWLRMPPFMLAGHLLRKSVRRLRSTGAGSANQSTA